MVAYLDGNSLGRPLAAIADGWADLAQRQWAGRLIRGWTEGWMELPELVGDELAAAALGAAAGQTVIADSTTVNFYKAVRAALNLRPGRRRIIVDRDNFPTNRYVVESLAKDLGLEVVWLTGTDGGGISVGDMQAQLDEDTAVLTMSHVAYHSGYLADVRRSPLRHCGRRLVVWDLCHSVGSTPIALDGWDVDFAVGCTYKFVGAGPGAPAFSYVNARHHTGAGPADLGLARPAERLRDGTGVRSGSRHPVHGVGTPSMPGILAVREGAKVIAEAGIDAIRAKAVALTEMAIAMTDERLVPLGFQLALTAGSGPPRRACQHRADPTRGSSAAD